ncbi:short-chain dehydrogenase/reductase [Siphonobacter sp. BAB-5385]|uniref:SDR family oxidoreductase n=1 Tax=Siphonobacter sp. BAB-5385 TaxID=1864822 RepID=UPI000B9E2196|nr:SDR family oxidoreductase [Siphonobacter sp. BAB-5385]OZI06828.1 short-chain dehydrogenase/reductase [Siphonobacter sp. BAB-5385]
MNQTILITGASSGLGKETAQLFQSSGWNVIATMRNPEKETELRNLPNVWVTKLDVLEPATIENAIREGLEQFGTIDVLVNNAGYGAYGPLESIPRDKVIRQFHTNVIGLIDVTQALLPHFRQQQSGMILNISSTGGKMAFPLGSLYHGTKFAVEGFSESLAYELEPLGIRVKLIEPGAIATNFTGRSLDLSVDEKLTEYQPIIAKALTSFDTLFQQASSPATIARVVYQAATDGSDQLRYSAGADAAVMIDQRRQLSDEDFRREVKVMFGL